MDTIRARMVLPFLVAAIVLGCRAHSSNPEAGPLRLILVISVDQMRSDYLTRFADLYTGGFHEMLAKGASFTNAYYHHSATETGPGHSVILTGRHGSHSGIVANGWYDRLLKKWVNVVDDPLNKPLAGTGRGASPANLIGFTVGDIMKTRSPGSRVIGVALKDRSAVLMAGKRADGAFWYDWKEGIFVTSSYYMNALPEWLQKWDSAKHADRYAGTDWVRLNPDATIYEKYAGPDAVEGESDRVHTTFPHKFEHSPPHAEYYGEIGSFPAADELTLEVALEAMKAYDLGTDDVADLLAVGFSGTDIIGHTYGPDSQEIMDQLLRLDLLIQRLLREANQRSGGRVLVILTADHGVMPLVENLTQRGEYARRVNPGALRKQIEEALAQEFPGAGQLIASFDPPHVSLNDSAMVQKGLSKTRVAAVVARALRESGLVERVYTSIDFAGDPPAGDPYFPLVRNSYFAPRSPDVIGVLKKYVYLDDYPGGTGHGTVHDYDRHVPIVFLGSGIRAGAYGQPCGPEDIAPTLARLLELDFPKEDDARVLSEILPEGMGK